MFKRAFFLYVFLLPVVASARLRIPESCETNPTECVIDLFIQIAKYRRPSLGEQEISEAIRELSAHVAPRWNKLGGLRYQSDAVGNQLIALPGTGRFAGTTRSIALQAHKDMVETVKGIERGDVSRFFRRGVKVERTDGILHSQGFQTTLGADNGIGLALLLRYLIDPSLEHPPIELIFTVSEENNGMLGARKLGLDFTSEVLLNLDQEEDDTVCFGCMGGHRMKVEGSFATTPLGPLSLIDVTVKGFERTHSGLLLHEKRTNPIRLGGELLAVALQISPQTRLVSLHSGDIQVLNRTPGNLEMRLAISAADIEKVQSAMERKSAELQALAIDQKYRPQPAFSSVRTARNLQTFERDSSERIAKYLAECPNNTLESGDPERFPFGVLSGSSLGAAAFTDGRAVLGYMARGYQQEPLERASQSVAEALSLIWEDRTKFSVSPLAQTPAWDGDPNSWIMQMVMKAHPELKAIRAQGGLEVGVLLHRFTQLMGLSFGASIQDAHEATERVSVASIDKMRVLMESIVQLLGDFWKSGQGCNAYLSTLGTLPPPPTAPVAP